MNHRDDNVEERLRALDPAAGLRYEHPDVEGMLLRVTAADPVARVSFARGFRLKMGAAATAASLVAVGSIALLQGAVPSVSQLAFGRVASPVGASAAATAASGQNVPRSDVLRPQSYQFVAGPDLSSDAATAPSYVLSAPGDFAAASASIASVFGVSGAPSSTPGPDSYWTVGDTSGEYVSFWTDNAELNWEYTDATLTDAAAPVTSDSAPTAISTTGIDDALALRLAQSDLDGLGVAGPFGDATYGSDGPFTDGQSWTSVTIPWNVGGPGSGFAFDFTFDASSSLVSADGVAVSVTSGSAYPLVSEAAGVAQLQSEQSSQINGGGPILYSPPATSAPSDSDTSGSSGDDVTTTTTPTDVVTLDAATIEYAEYTLSDGTEVLLPQYVYTGDDGSQWTVLAVDPQYVSLDTNSDGGAVTPLAL